MYQQPMSFWEATKLYWTRAFDFKGRSRRKEYWVPIFTESILFTFAFFVFITFILVITAAVAADSTQDKDTAIGIFALFGITGVLFVTLIGLVILIPNLSLFVRRLHDVGRSGKWVLIFYVLPIVLAYLNMGLRYVLETQNLVVLSLILQGIIVMTNLVIAIWGIVWCAQDSQPGPNQWGPNPKAIDNERNHNPYQSNYYQQNPNQ